MDLRVLSYNVHMQKDDQAALTALIRGLAPDVVVIQEGPRRFRWRARAAALAHSLGMVVAAGGLPSLGNLILTTFRVRVHDAWYAQFPLIPGRHMRGAAFASCSIGPARFVVAGTHLSTDPAERPAQARDLKDALSKLDDPVILGADLNEGSGGAAWRTLADGLTDAATAMDRTDRLTFSCADPRDRIDALFVSPGIQVRDYDVVDTAESRRASDHFPVLADLTLPR